MLCVYGDESADETKERVFAVGGVIGREDDWAALEGKWRGRTGGVPFHANDCESDQGDFKGRLHSENLALYRDLATILAESGNIGGWAFAIDLKANREAFPDSPDLSYYKGFLEVIYAMKNCAANNSETVRFIFDMRQESEHNAGMLYGMFAELPELKQYVADEISFVSSKDNARVQVADLFTREAMKALDNTLAPIGKRRNPRKSWKALYNTGRFHVEAISIDWFNSLKREIPQNVAAAYWNWLRKHNRQHNVTNMFAYMSAERLKEWQRNNETPNTNGSTTR